MSESKHSGIPTDEELSALIDGDAHADVVTAACRQWRNDDRQRERWHTYHLIGDVLRNDELARPAAHDEAFLQAFRERLAREPVVLAPSVPIEVPGVVAAPKAGVVVDFPANDAALARRQRSRLRRWSAPVGMAAGVALVAGAVFMNRPGSSEVMTLADLRPATPASASVPFPVQPMDPRVSNDAQLVRYFNDHKQYSGVPIEGARNASFSQPIATGQ